MQECSSNDNGVEIAVAAIGACTRRVCVNCGRRRVVIVANVQKCMDGCPSSVVVNMVPTTFAEVEGIISLVLEWSRLALSWLPQ
jgi:hypothetical protein